MDQAQSPQNLAEPFSTIFTDWTEAEWAFDLLRDTAKHLDIHGAYDHRFALTLAQRSGHLGLHLNFGGWLVLGFHGSGQVELTLLADQVTWDERFNSLPFERKEGEPEVRSYHLPLALLRPLTSTLTAAYEATLAFIAHKFAAWKRASHWKLHNPEIAEALFNPEQRRRVLSGLLSEPELRYERHLTAFYQDISEEREGYEVGEVVTNGIESEEALVDISADQSLSQIKSQVHPSPHIQTSAYFTLKTFDLLAGLHATPTKDYYMAHKEEFKSYVEKPFQYLFQQVAAQLPSAITELMETEKKIFAKILKNDYGQGGAWDFYWGAFYPKGGKRTEDAQLLMWINYELLEFGFYIGNYGKTQQKRFIRNCQENYNSLAQLLQNVFSNQNIVFVSHNDYTITADGSIVSKLNLSWQEWLQSPNRGNFDVSFVLPKNKVLQYSTEELTHQIVQAYSQIFPLIFLATFDSPMPMVTQYLASIENKKHINSPVLPSSILHPPSSPPYPLAQLAEETGLDESELARWVRAIERKGQAILYGPPGTGKTFIAERLAQHLTAGGAGLWELVQFHPAYAYEDFIQGIRPTSQASGLSYQMKAGRFLEFCARAKERPDICVLIIDEINRANLSRVFGELMYLLEYRDQAIPLAGGGELSIPANVRLIGTMNTADRSIALVDHALRRRFAFIALTPNYELLQRFHQRHPANFPVDNLITVLKSLNQAIGDRHYQVGVTFFLRPNLAGDLEDIWRMEIEPYLEEYFFDQPDKVTNFSWANIKAKIL